MTRTVHVLFVVCCLGAVSVFAAPVAAGVETVDSVGDVAFEDQQRLGADPVPPGDCGPYEGETPQNGTVVRLHAVAGDTDTTELPDRVSVNRSGDRCVVAGDRLVLSVRSTDLSAAIDDASGTDLPTKFVTAQSDDPILRLRQAGSETGDSLYVDLTDEANLSVVRADGPDSYHVVVDTDAVRVTRGPPEDGGESASLEPGTRLVATHAPEAGDTPRSEPMTVTAAVATVDTNYHNWDENRTLFVSPRSPIEVTGATTLAPDERITVRFVDATTNETLETRGVTLDAGTDTRSTFATTFDASYADDGGRFWVQLASEDQNLTAQVPVEVVPSTASVTLDDQTATDTVTVSSVTLSRGGFVSLRQDGNLVAVSEFLDRGETTNLTLELASSVDAESTFSATAYRDLNGNGDLDDADVPYRDAGALVDDDAMVNPEGDTTTTTAQPTSSDGSGDSTTTSAPPTEDTLTTTTEPSADESGAGTPGFGPLSALGALAALVGAVLLARRRA
ncbi:DUF7282 domain-containing protein [Haloarchaeobius sp. DFWS5]|uniref:DUF7282 domain-containing protein n=1 Tax=Haloarchaeobius sp. DFWS5 TaxID=3446114 RepID=UPI003EBC5DB0